MLNRTIPICIEPGGVPEIIYISQFDVGLQTFVFVPYTNNGTLTIPSGASATLEGTKPDGYAFVHNCTYNTSNGQITYTVQDQLAAVAGRVWSKLVIRDTSGNILGFRAIVWIVDYAGVKDGAVVSDSDLSALEEFVKEFGSINAYKAALDGAMAAVGGPLTASTVAQMTDKTKVYVYTGSQSGYTSGHWYYWNGSAWTDGGVYQATAVETDKNLTVADMAADGKATGDAITELKNDLSDVSESIPKEYQEITKLSESTGKLITNTGKVGNSSSEKVTISVYEAKGGRSYRFVSDSYSTSSGYPAITFNNTDNVVVGESAGTILLNGSSTSESVDFSFSPQSDGYFWVQKYGSRGELSVLLDEYDITGYVDNSIQSSIDSTLTQSNKSANALSVGYKFRQIENALSPTEIIEEAISEYTGKMINTIGRIADSSVEANAISVYHVLAGISYILKSDSYATYGANYPSVCFKDTPDVTTGELAGEIILNGFDEQTSVDTVYTPLTTGYLLVQKNSGKGSLGIYTNGYSDFALESEMQNANNQITRINEEIAKIPKEKKYSVEYTEHAGFLFTATRVNSYNTASIFVFPVLAGYEYHFMSDSYSTRYDNYPVAVFTTTDSVEVGAYSGTVVINAITSSQRIDETFTSQLDGFIWINHFSNSGEISVYYYGYGQDIAKPVLYGKTIAILGDSIMQYMSGGYGGPNTQTFVENGNSHTYDEITITDGIPYYNGIECTVVNEKQSYYDSQGWEYLKTATGAETILNCAIGGSVLNEGTICTAYPGYESGTWHTNSLPNLTRWLFRRCQEQNANPDLVVIWMGTNGLSMEPGDVDTIFGLTWEELSGDTGHVYRQTAAGALRYAIERIYREMPHTYILVLGPIQADPVRNPSRSFQNLLNRSNLMKSVSQRISIKFIEALTEIEVYGLIETDGNERYLTDGVHCTDAGKRLLTDFLNKHINSNYQYKY